MRILVVEDDRESASWLIKGLTEAGHVADHARRRGGGVALACQSSDVHDRGPHAARSSTASLPSA